MKKLLFVVCGVLALGAVSTFAEEGKKSAKHECKCKGKDHAKCDKCHKGQKECTCDHAKGEHSKDHPEAAPAAAAEEKHS